MKKYIMLRDVICLECNGQMYTERQEDGELTLKCTDEACKNFNKPFRVPSVVLQPYVPAPVKK